MPSASHGGAFHDPDAAAAAAAEAAAAAATPERRCAARLRWLAACVAYKAVRDKGVWEALDLSVAACDALKACVSGAEGPGPLADTDTDPLQRQLANLLCDRMARFPPPPPAFPAADATHHLTLFYVNHGAYTESRSRFLTTHRLLVRRACRASAGRSTPSGATPPSPPPASPRRSRSCKPRSSPASARTSQRR